MKSWYTKLNLEKSKESARRGAERTIVREHPKDYKDDVANFSNSASIKSRKYGQGSRKSGSLKHR
ncbi:MAG TPA: palindromic element RPE5 domain-containing protein [Rickettsia endosymbiont of Pyrocoelia pectoralis]|nr:palindromic element RPE5 domain-containing protein [Rickettsia endosymbiont of Pyrocoelia pectoralis]